MSEYILSDPVETPPVIPGTEKVKDPFTGEQKKQAGFSVRMERAVKQLEE